MSGTGLWIAMLAAQPAAPLPSLPVPLAGGEYGPCSTARVIDLPRGDRLVVRSEPAREARALAQLRNGRDVYACVRRGDWFGIVWERGGRHTGCNVLNRPRPRRVHSVYIGPCPSGWVHRRYLGGYADWISP